MSTVGVHVDNFTLKCIDNHPIITEHQIDSADVDEKKHEQQQQQQHGVEHEVTVDILDFAGQIEYYVTHQLFLSDVYCMYVVVSSLYQRQSDGSMKLKSNICSGRIRFWLSFLSSLFDRNTQVPVSIVLSHGDCNKSGNNDFSM